MIKNTGSSRGPKFTSQCPSMLESSQLPTTLAPRDPMPSFGLTHTGQTYRRTCKQILNYQLISCLLKIHV